MLLCYQLFSKSVVNIERRIADRMSSGNWSPVRCRCRCSKISHAWMVCTSSISAAFGGDRICLLSSGLLPAADGSWRAANLPHCSKHGSRSAPRTISGASPSVLEVKNIAILGPSHSSCRTHAKSVSRRLASSGALRPSSPASALRAPLRRSPLPDMTKFSNSARSSFRTGRASKSFFGSTKQDARPRIDLAAEST